MYLDVAFSTLCVGYDTTYQSPFPMVGRNGTNLNDKWSPHPITYLSVCVDEFPNWFFSLGPNAGVGSGSLLAVIEKQVEYAVEVTKKLQRERLKTIEVKAEAVQDYDEYIEASNLAFSTAEYTQCVIFTALLPDCECHMKFCHCTLTPL